MTQGAVVAAIKEVIGNGARTKTEILDAVRAKTGCSRNRVDALIKRHEGDGPDALWNFKVVGRGAMVYSLNKPGEQKAA